MINSSGMDIVTSGADGHRGRDGHHGSYGGGRGGDGTDGAPGAHARDIHVQLLCPDNVSCSVQGNFCGAFPLGPQMRLFLEARGGKGGNGGHGGDGGSGTAGTAGRDATQYSSGGNGTNGGPGGNGGHGGDGGDGGKGGTVRVTASDNDMDLFMLPNKCDVSGGEGGAAGKGGSGGPGGPGGPGGSSYSWTTTRYETKRNSDGSTYTQTYTEYHSQPGGMSGSTGPSGSSGRSGKAGRRGQDGSFRLGVAWAGQSSPEWFTWRYVAQVTSPTIRDATNQDGIFEPDEQCGVFYYVYNNGPMPTPKVQRLFATVLTNNWFHSPSTSWVNQQLVQNQQSAGLNQEITIHLRDQAEPPPNICFKDQTTAKWDVHVERVRKHFTPTEMKHPGLTIDVQWPVQSTVLHGAPVISGSEEAPLVACVHNLCKRALGRNSTDLQRLARVRVTLVRDANSMIPMTDSMFAIMIDEKGYQIPYREIDASVLYSKGNLFPSQLVRFGPDVPEYCKVTVGLELFIGKVHEPLVERRIQRMSIDVQRSDYYTQKKDANVLVVTNHQTTRESFCAWNKMVRDASLQPNFWNATQHDGLTLEQNVNGSTVKEDFTRGVIFIENNNPMFLTTVATNRNKDNEYAADTIPRNELTRSTRDHQTGFVTIGRGIDVRNRLLPTDRVAVAIPTAEPKFFPGLQRSNSYWKTKLHALPIQSSANKAAVKKSSETSAAAAAAGPKTDEPEVIGKLEYDFERLHNKYQHQFGSSVAWQLVWGLVTTDTGVDAPLVQFKRFPSALERLRFFMDWYAPWVSHETLVQLSTAARNAEEITSELERLWGCEEPTYSDRYEYVTEATRTSIVQNATSVKKIMSQRAHQLYVRIANIRPQWKFMVEFDIAPHVYRGAPQGTKVKGITMLENRERPFMQTYCLGRLYVSRAANRNGSCFVHLPLNPNEAIAANFVESQYSAQAALRQMTFTEKINYAVSHSARVTKFTSLIRDAIIGDVIEEQSALRRLVWQSSIPDCALCDHTPLLCTLAAAITDHSTCQILEEAAAHIYVVLNRWVRWHDRMIFHRRWRILSSNCTAILSAAVKASEDKKARFFAHATKFQESVKEMDLTELLSHAQRGILPLRTSANTELQYRGISSDAVRGMANRESPAQVVVGRWEMLSERDRRLVLHKLRCDFNPETGLYRDHKTTRERAHHRLNFIECPQGHHSAQAHALGGCQVCLESLEDGRGGKQCSQCGWIICAYCWDRGNQVKWLPPPEKEDDEDRPKV